MWNEAAIEDAIRKYLATKDEVKLLGCDIRCYYDQHERAEENAILIKAYSTENMNYGCQGRGPVWQTNIVVQVIGTVLDDAARVKHNHICGVVEAALDDMQVSDIVITNVTIYGILWGEPSNSLNVEEIIGTSLPSLKVIYEK